MLGLQKTFASYLVFAVPNEIDFSVQYQYRDESSTEGIYLAWSLVSNRDFSFWIVLVLYQNLLLICDFKICLQWQNWKCAIPKYSRSRTVSMSSGHNMKLEKFCHFLLSVIYTVWHAAGIYFGSSIENMSAN